MIRWHLDTTVWSGEDYTRLLETVHADERRRISKFYFQKDRNLALGSTLLQYRFIADVLAVADTSSSAICRDANGRPFFRHPAARPNDFNVSHHAGAVVLVGRVDGGRVGVDLTTVEDLSSSSPDASASPSRVSAVDEYLDNFRDSFSAVEWQQIDRDLTRFAQHWALKESYVKLTGTGIVVDLPSIEFRRVKYVDALNPKQPDAAVLAVGRKPISKSPDDHLTPPDIDVEAGGAHHFELHLVDHRYIAVATESKVDFSPFVSVTF